MKKIAPVYFGVTDNRSRVAEERYIDAKRRRDAVQEMFAEEIRMERRKKDPCYKCAYNRHAPCIGFCYQQMTAHPVDPNEKSREEKLCLDLIRCLILTEVGNWIVGNVLHSFSSWTKYEQER